MMLLFDQNLSPKLVNHLADLFPDSTHVQSVGLDCAIDDQIWEFAKQNGFAIVTKDEDYNNLSVVRGSPQRSSGSSWATAQRPKWRLCFVAVLSISRGSRRIPPSAR